MLIRRGQTGSPDGMPLVRLGRLFGFRSMGAPVGTDPMQTDLCNRVYRTLKQCMAAVLEQIIASGMASNEFPAETSRSRRALQPKSGRDNLLAAAYRGKIHLMRTL